MRINGFSFQHCLRPVTFGHPHDRQRERISPPVVQIMVFGVVKIPERLIGILSCDFAIVFGQQLPRMILDGLARLVA